MISMWVKPWNLMFSILSMFTTINMNIIHMDNKGDGYRYDFKNLAVTPCQEFFQNNSFL